jgi:hypothetical protein
MNSLVDKGYNLFLDSGAYSAFNTGKRIGIDRYINYLKNCKAPYYAALDVMHNAEKTEENLLYMESKGLKPIPTFHVDSPDEFLIHMLNGKYDYIALGGMVTKKNKLGLMKRLDEIWKIIIKYNEKIKVHGFGMTSEKIMMYYPWYSIDSSSWVSSAIFGRGKSAAGQTHIWDIQKKYFGCKTIKELLKIPNRVRTEVILKPEIERFQILNDKINKAHGNNFQFDNLYTKTLFD